VWLHGLKQCGISELERTSAVDAIRIMGCCEKQRPGRPCQGLEDILIGITYKSDAGHG